MTGRIKLMRKMQLTPQENWRYFSQMLPKPLPKPKIQKKEGLNENAESLYLYMVPKAGLKK